MRRRIGGLWKLDPADLDRFFDRVTPDASAAATAASAAQNPARRTPGRGCRHTAAKAAGLERIAAVEKSFDSEDAAVEYAIHCQRDRRNLSDADLLRWIAEVDKRKTKAESAANARQSKGSVATPVATTKRSSEETAEIVGTSRGKVEKARTIIARPPPRVPGHPRRPGDLRDRRSSPGRPLASLNANAAPVAFEAVDHRHAAPSLP